MKPFHADCALALAACAARPVKTPARRLLPGSIEDLSAKTVALVVDTGEKVRPYCSGVWVSGSDILTANHCLDADEDSTLYTVRDEALGSDGKAREDMGLHTAKVVGRDKLHDLLLLRSIGQAPAHEVGRVTHAPVVPGMRVSTMGHPLGLWYSYSSGQVSAIRVVDFDPEIVLVQTTAPTSKGNSGCGLWNDRGELVGIAHAGMPAGANLAFYIHVRHVTEFLGDEVR